VGALLAGIAASQEDDDARLVRSRELFNDLYAYFSAHETSHSRERKGTPSARKGAEP
jgi:hypothetical protein